MPDNFNSVSGPTPNPGGTEQQNNGFIVFGPSSTSNTSVPYTVDNQPLYIQAYNLDVMDVITVEMVNGVGASIVSAPCAVVFGPVTLNTNRTKLKIDYPGRYRFVHTGPSPISSLLVTGFIQTMTQEPTMDLATALFDVLNNGVPLVIGTNPIRVVGNGLAGTPYNVSLILSPDPGNLLEIRPNGLYYGTIPPIQYQYQFVSSSLGNDANPGTRASPLKTIQKALSNLRDGQSGIIYLYRGDTFYTYPTIPLPVTLNTISNLNTAEIFAFANTLDINNRHIQFYPYDDPAIDFVGAYNQANTTFYYPYHTAETIFPIIAYTVAIPTDSPTINIPIGFTVGSAGSLKFFAIKHVSTKLPAVSPPYDYGNIIGNGEVSFDGGHIVVSNIPMIGSPNGSGSQTVTLSHVQMADYVVPSTPPLFCTTAAQYFIPTVSAVAPGAEIIPGVPAYTEIGDNVEAFLTPAGLWPGIVVYSTAFRSFRHVITAIPIA